MAVLNGVFGVVCLLLSVILVHEFFHFLVARAFGVKVNSFSVGFGPVLWKRNFADTEWRFCALPLGGQIRMLGEDPSEVVAEVERGRSFSSLGALKKTCIVIAGAVGNVVLAVLLFAWLFFSGLQVVAPEVGGVESGSVAEMGGLRKGDVILSVDGAMVDSWDAAVKAIRGKPGRTVDVKVERGNGGVSLRMVPEKRPHVDSLKRSSVVGYIGVSAAGRVTVVQYGLLESVVKGAMQAVEVVDMVVVAVAKIVDGSLSTSVLSGPVMIAKTVGDAASVSLQYYLGLVAVISVNLGVINLFPLLPFDGGYVVFFAVEALRGKPASVRTLVVAQQVGIVLLLALFVFVVYLDFVKIGLVGGM